MRKIVPAAGMLSISAVMLATSTYAWFTMSREVEVQNIQMTATVPEDLQISLGTLGSATGTAATKESEGFTLAKGTGVLVANSGTSANDGNVKAPTNDWDWSNTADITDYYQIGKLMPASSTNGKSIFLTPDADGVGKTVKEDAAYYTAVSDLTPSAESTLKEGASKTHVAATLHAITSTTKSDDKWSTAGNASDNYNTATAWNVTNDDGYYVDIPIWLRTSSTQNTNISVQAYVIPKTATQQLNTDNEALYKAVRVALITPTTGAETTENDAKVAAITTSNLLPVNNAWNASSDGTNDGTIKQNPYTLPTGDTKGIIDFYTRNTGEEAVASISSGTSAAYGTASIYSVNSTVATLQKSPGTTGNAYGPAKKLIVRVWLEGEDKDCWNDTAGQDWSINLKFNNETTNQNGATGKNVSNTASPTTPGSGTGN